MRIFALLLVGLLSACSHRPRYPTFDEAMALRGSSAEQVQTALGSPADKLGDERFHYFLSYEKPTHPAQKAELFELIFSGGRLVEIRELKEKASSY